MAEQNDKLFNNLLEYFQSQADSLDAKAKGSRIYENRPDIGTDREDILLEFLDGHLPRRCRIVKGGYIFDSSGNQSKQIDLIITNDLTLQFTKLLANRFQKSFNCIEGCYCAISVKSILDKGAFCDAVENLASLPENKSMNLNPQLKPSPQLLDEIPLGIIFAYKGDKVEYIERLMEDIQSTNLNLPDNFPNMIIVNNSYLIEKVGSQIRSLASK
jgi:hypothetical protein